ncbi:MAG: carbohydrate-binding family 9-like protein [Pyrinomonadaceae bacterium]|nr:carbohydrate-binding family 9-like protein [Pyrinomonadaceae bacterium]
MKRVSFAIVTLRFLGVFPTLAHNKMSNAKRLRIVHISDELAIGELNSAIWDKARDIAITKYWSGVVAPATRQFNVRLLWSDTALYVRFEAAQNEPLIVSEKPDLTQKIKGLWDRDVCEIFIAPDKKNRNKYFEFEIAPTGEWIDLGIEVTPKARLTDWDYRSDMTSAAFIEAEKIVMAIKIPFAALGKTPKAGDVWLGNLFRCVGKDPTRGYLAWQPTNTKEPAFHVPKAFGEFRFVK